MFCFIYFIHFLIFPSLSYANEEGLLTRQNYQTERVCHFPESEERPFFIDIPSGPPPRSILLDTVVEPPDAKLEIANVRSNNLAQEQIHDWLSLEKRPNGQFLLFSNDIISQTSSTTTSVNSSLKLPAYPSSINESLLYVTVRCNGRLYPLLTVRLLTHNLHAPEWWIHGIRVAEDSIAGEISIPKNSKTFGSLFDTQLLALDQEPAEHYPITFSVDPPLNKYFSIELGNRSSLPINEQVNFLSTLHFPYSNRIEDWHEQQLPPQILLKLLDEDIILNEKEQLIINITATDNGIPEERKSRIKLRFLLISEEQEKTNNVIENGKFSKSVYYGNFTKEMRSGTEIIPSEPINANFPLQRAGDRIIYDLDISSNPYAALFQIERDSGRIRLVEQLPEQPPQNIEMDILATLLPKNSSNNRQVIRTKLILTDRTEIKLTYFTQCHYLVHLAENPSAFTRILQFNFKGDVEGVELLNGTELFKVDPYGLVSVLPGVDIDRERTERIVIKAKLKVNKSSLHPKSLELCQIATAEILIDDVNDHSPKFTQKVYRFRIDPFPYNNTEVGSLRAVDGDAEEFGHLRYRILDEFVPDGHGGEEPLPFVLFQADGAATLFFVIKPTHLQLFQQPYKPQSEYTFTVEAYDSDEDPRTARVSVNVRIEEEKEILEEQQQHHHHLTNNEQLLDEVRGERKHQRSAINEEIEGEEEDISPKAWATRIRTVDKDVPPILIRRQGKSSTTTTTSNTNTFKNTNQNLRLRNEIKFSQNNYIFRMFGNLFEGQTIGWVSSVKRKMSEEGDLEDRDGNKEEILDIEKEESLIEYAVEEGIDGFVGVDMFSGRLFVGPKLVGGAERFEEIRFSVAAMHPRDGRIWATALVSVIFDESTPTIKPFFDRQQFNFEVDLSNLKHFPTFLGQIQAEIKTNKTELTEIPLIIYLIEEQKNEIKIIENKQKEVVEAVQISPSDLFSIGRESGKIHLMRKPTENELSKREGIKFKVFACSNYQTQKYQQQQNHNNSPTKAPGSTIINLSVRIHDPNDGNWHLIPNGIGGNNQQNNQNMPSNLNYWIEGEGENLFTIYGNSLLLKNPLKPGQFDINLRARLQRKGKIYVAEHKLRIIVIDDELPQLYPVFEKISHEFNIDPEGHFPVVFPPLNASLAGGGSENIRFNLFPARRTNTSSSFISSPFPFGKGGEVFLVVRAVNQALNDKQQKYFSDASISIIIKQKLIPPLKFESTLYRYILSERQPSGSILENGPPIRILEPNLHSNIRIRLATSPQTVWALKHFGLMPNGSLMLKEEVDMEKMLDKSQGLIKMEVVAEDISEGKEARAKVEIQLIDNNEHNPVFTPLFPKFYLQPETLFAGHPIGKLSVKDEDFTDRQGDTLAFRAISGNASNLVHVQRDGQLIIKDQNAALPGVYTLLVEVQDFGGLSARTTATFILLNYGEKFTSIQPGMEKGILEEKGTTVEFPLPPVDLEGEEVKEQNTKIIASSGGGNNLAPIFSVRDSIDWENMRKIDKNMSQNLNFVLEENNYKGLFRMDKQSGQLFLEENKDLIDRQKEGGGNDDNEYELRVRVESPMDEGDKEKNGKDSNPRILLRRVYTVRLVPSIAVGIQTINNKSSTNEVNIEESTIPTTESSFTQLFSTNSDNITTLSDEESLGTITFSSSSISSPSFSESSTAEEITTTINHEFSTKELIEETTTLLTNREELTTTTTNNLEEEFSPSTTLKVPSARPLEFSPTFSTKIPTKPSTSPQKHFQHFLLANIQKQQKKLILPFLVIIGF
uniref:Cadherin domain-containing protein n=1 Tax=Meloidogyne enterolobii TaxID=390850 RepID=A0A6V7V2W1_MELEN|nr:unnamed protein product [Meloidogyne enterolobii]